MKFNFDLDSIKTTAKNKFLDTKDFLKKYKKRIGAGFVIGCLLIAVISTKIHDIGNKFDMHGTMMSISDVADHETYYSGKCFEVAGITYEDMLDINYHAEQLAHLEISDTQYDETLLSESPNAVDQAAVDALTSGGGLITADMSDSYTSYNGPVEYTYVTGNEEYTFLGEYLLTAYCACPICCGSYSNMENPRTASGTTPVQGRTVAAPPNLAFGTQLMINGQVFVVEDRGGAIQGNRLDVFFNSHEEALRFARQSAYVYMIN